jgi:hypothetical protein
MLSTSDRLFGLRRFAESSLVLQPIIASASASASASPPLFGKWAVAEAMIRMHRSAAAEQWHVRQSAVAVHKREFESFQSSMNAAIRTAMEHHSVRWARNLFLDAISVFTASAQYDVAHRYTQSAMQTFPSTTFRATHAMFALIRVHLLIYLKDKAVRAHRHQRAALSARLVTKWTR